MVSGLIGGGGRAAADLPLSARSAAAQHSKHMISCVLCCCQRVRANAHAGCARPQVPLRTMSRPSQQVQALPL